MIKVFTDGAEGTTGLQLEERLNAIDGLELLKIDERLRKDETERARLINVSDVTFLCLPDDEARRSVEMCENRDTVIIDASTAHRTQHGWAYGFPELSPEHEKAVRTGNRIAVPGCHAGGFIAAAYPLVESGLIKKGEQLYCHSLTGYSGGGKKMIGEYEGKNPPRGARPYAPGLRHKHLPEMTAVCGLKKPPIFLPAVIPVRQGMIVSVPLPLGAEEVFGVLSEHYKNAGAIRVKFLEDPTANIDPEALRDTDDMELLVSGHDTQTVVWAVFDNLGKGAAGAAVQCFKLRKGL